MQSIPSSNVLKDGVYLLCAFAPSDKVYQSKLISQCGGGGGYLLDSY